MLRSALFIDFDNLYISLENSDPDLASYFGNRPTDWLHRLAIHGVGAPRRFLVRRCYLNPRAFYDFRPSFIAAGFDVIDCPPVTTKGKTAADMHMALDILDRLGHSTRFDEFIILSGDSDFTPVLKKLREHDRRSFVVAGGPTSVAFRACTDELASFLEVVIEEQEPSSTAAEVAPAEPTVQASQGVPSLDASVLRSELLKMSQESGPMSTSAVLNELRRKYGAAAENWFGLGKASAFFGALRIQEAELAFSPHPPGYLYLPSRHELPKQPSPAAPGISSTERTWMKSGRYDPAIVHLALRVSSLTDAPCLSTEEYAECFGFLLTHWSEEARLNDLSRELRDYAKGQNISVSRAECSSLVYGLTRNGIASGKASSPAAMAEAYSAAVEYLCAQCQWTISPEERTVLRRWIGCPAAAET